MPDVDPPDTFPKGMDDGIPGQMSHDSAPIEIRIHAIGCLQSKPIRIEIMKPHDAGDPSTDSSDHPERTRLGKGILKLSGILFRRHGGFFEVIAEMLSPLPMRERMPDIRNHSGLDQIRIDLT